MINASFGNSATFRSRVGTEEGKAGTGEVVPVW